MPLRVYLALFTYLALALTLGAAASPEAPTPLAVTPPRLPDPEQRLRAATPRVRELLTIWEAREAQLARLRAELAASKDRGHSAAIENEIERFKFETDLEMMRLQAEHARRAGQVEMADQLEGTITQLSAQRVQSHSLTVEPAVPVQLAPIAGEQQ